VLITPKQNNLLIRNSLPYFIAKTFTTTEPVDYKHNWHIDYIAEYLEAIRRRDITRLIINLPPGYTKSVAVNIAFSAYVLGHNPKERIISASCDFLLALAMSNKTKMVMESDWYKEAFPDTQIKQEVENTQRLYKTIQGGGRQACSVGGKIIGGSASMIIVDDPIDVTDAEAKSGIHITNANNWYDASLYQRLRDKKKGPIVIIMQRLKANDLAGHLLKRDNFEHCVIPCIEDTVGGRVYSFGRFEKKRKEGEYLFEEIEGKKEIESAKVRLGTYGFAGQYQQRPAPLGGGIFKKEWFGEYESRRDYTHIVLSLDTAYKPEQHNDPSVCITWGIHENGYDILHVWRKRVLYTVLQKQMLDLAHASKPTVYGVNYSILIEDKASGSALIPVMREETKYPITAINPCVDKETRARTIAPIVEQGKVFLPKNALWKEVFMLEVLTFDKSEHDDQVDAMTQFLNWVSVGIPTTISDEMTDNKADEKRFDNKQW